MTQCSLCGHTLEKIEGQLRCKVCEAFHSDMTLDWIDYIHKKIEKDEEDEGAL